MYRGGTKSSVYYCLSYSIRFHQLQVSACTSHHGIFPDSLPKLVDESPDENVENENDHEEERVDHRVFIQVHQSHRSHKHGLTITQIEINFARI